MSKTVLVTGIGGVVGQGILKNIRSEYPSIAIIGTNTVPVSPGNHLCDEVYQVPFGDADHYIPTIERLVEEHNVDLVIPSTDLESYHLSKYQGQLRAKVAASAPEVAKMCLDKLETFRQLDEAGIPFAKSFLPADYSGELQEIIVKPRSGRGSRNIYVNPEEVHGFDHTYLDQELIRGEEITTACYVTRAGELHSHISFTRELENGNTNKAEVTFKYDELLKPIIEQLIVHFDFMGSFNIQSMVRDNKIIPFEINCRISGTNSIRSHFGFKDVMWTLQEWLLDESLAPAVLTGGSALRIIDDLIYPEQSLSEISNRKDNFITG